MSSSVKLSFLNQVFSKYDIDKSGTLDRPELAKASLNLMGQDDAQSQAAGRLLATFVQGGADKSGLLPDFNGDGAVSKAELAKLASAGGQSDSIDSSDFKAVFGSKAQDGGNDISVADLEQVASGNTSKFNYQNNPQAFTNSVGSLLPEGFQNMLSSMMSLLQQFARMLGSQ